MYNKIFNQIIVYIAKLLPLSITKIVAGRYVAGEQKSDALTIIKELNTKGYSATIDILGEHSKTKQIANTITDQYISLYKSIYSSELDCNISIKPSHIGLDIDKRFTQRNLFNLLKIAINTNNFLRIDMEDSKLTNQTIELYKIAKKQKSNIGIVLQAYLYRSYEDLKELSKISKFNFRLCKGIYKENSRNAFQNKNEINNNFIKMLKYAFRNKH